MGSQVPLWRDARKLAILAQVLFVAGVAAAVWLVKVTVEASLARQNVRINWGFLWQPAGFDLTALTWTLDLRNWRFVPYSPENTYAEAMIAGLINTLRVASVGIVLAFLLGLVVGVTRLSRNWLISRLSLAYVEFLRNTPLLAQLFFWYFAIFLRLPPGTPQHPPLHLFGTLVTLTNQGLVIGGVAVERFGRTLFEGGFQMRSEYAALLIGLSVYTSAFIAEIIRGGIQAVHRGQMEAARSLGLTYLQSLRHILLPQTLRMIIPPLGNQFLNLTKNSSLAIAIGYADLLTAANTVSSQSFRSLETFTVVTMTYLVLSLIISAILNAVRARMVIPGM
ncbi:MAG: ABC transporter permease subunit [Armatimonadetes bacterium]|nr:ABC transporter permease subunit [Armatimonadota bacterium]